MTAEEHQMILFSSVLGDKRRGEVEKREGCKLKHLLSEIL